MFYYQNCKYTTRRIIPNMDKQESEVVNNCQQKEDICSVCMETVNTTDNGYLTSKCCKHLIHINCFVSYTLTNAQTANKCPMCRYDMNTGQPFQASEYNNSYNEEEYYYEYDDEDVYDSYYESSESENEDENSLTTVSVDTQQNKIRTATELNVYCATPTISNLTSQPISFDALFNYSCSGIAYYTSDKYNCLAVYNAQLCAMYIQYETKPPMAHIKNTKKIVSGDVPRCVSIQLTPNGALYVLTIYPDDGECDKMSIYFPHCETVIMSAFHDKSALAEHNLDNLQITGFSDCKFNNNFIYVNDCESTCGSLLAEVIEFQKLKYIFDS